MIKRFTRNPFLTFLPFLCYYAYLVVKYKWPTLYGDEVRYIDFTHNLLHGFYSPTPHINLWNGPGYPIILMPLVALHVPHLYITLFNALFLYLSIVLLYKAINLVTSPRIALVFCLLLAIYPNAQSVLPILYTEAFTMLLISALIYIVTLFYIHNKNIYCITAGLILGYIILTKIIFGYVVMIALAIGIAALLSKKHRAIYIQPVKILLIAFIAVTPYLAYTYYITGKALYWGNSGGMSLYWMSSPYENEYGDWKLPELNNRQYPMLFKAPEAVAMLRKNHAKEFKFILAHNEIQQDELFKQIAVKNIKAHPLKFIQNYYYNVARMLFNFPYSYSFQNAAIVRNILIGSLILWASVISTIITLFNWRRIIYPIRLMLFITAIYLGMSGALSSYPRQLDVMMPVLLFWMAFLAANLNKLNLQFNRDASPDALQAPSIVGVAINKTTITEA